MLALGSETGPRRENGRVLRKVREATRDDEATRERMHLAKAAVRQRHIGTRRRQLMFDEGGGMDGVSLLVQHSDDCSVAYDDFVIERGAGGVLW